MRYYLLSWTWVAKPSSEYQNRSTESCLASETQAILLSSPFNPVCLPLSTSTNTTVLRIPPLAMHLRTQGHWYRIMCWKIGWCRCRSRGPDILGMLRSSLSFRLCLRITVASCPDVLMVLMFGTDDLVNERKAKAFFSRRVRYWTWFEKWRDGAVDASIPFLLDCGSMYVWIWQ